MKHLVIVNGFAGSGKDTFCGYCEDYLYREDKISFIKHSSDFAKTILFSMDWDGEKTLETRKLLADMVTFGESTGFNLRDFFKFVENNQKLDVIFYHERNPKEIQKIVNYYKCSEDITVLTVFVNRKTDKVEEDRWNIRDFGYDVTIMNDKTLEELEKCSKYFCDFWLKGE